MDDMEQKALMYVLASEMKKYHHQTLAYQNVIEVVRQKLLPEITGLVEIALEAPDIQAEADRAFAFLDEMLPPIPEIDLEKVQRLWLEKWDYTGKSKLSGDWNSFTLHAMRSRREIRHTEGPRLQARLFYCLDCTTETGTNDSGNNVVTVPSAFVFTTTGWYLHTLPVSVSSKNIL